MKRFAYLWAARAAAAVMGVLAISSGARGQDRPVVSARPGERTFRPLPPATQGGIRLSLDEAVGLAVANNQDLNVTVNVAEASRWSLFSNQGIYDPLLQAALTRSHSESPATSTLAGATVPRSDVFDFSGSVQQLAPTGGVFSLGFTGRSLRTNSTFSSVNPSRTGTLTFSLNQPLLRSFGHRATNWLIYIARNSRDASYQDFVRSVQTTINSVEQAYWDLVYNIQNAEVKRESLRIAQDLNRITRIKIDVGSLAPIDITQTEVGIATAEQDIITAEGLIGDAQDSLKRLINFDTSQWNTPIIPTDQVRMEEAKIDLSEGMKEALVRRPEVIRQAYSADSDHLRYDYYSNQVLPSLNLVGSYGTIGLGGTFFVQDPTDPTGRRLIPVATRTFGDAYSDVFANKNKNWSVGLTFSYPLFNRAARGARAASRYTWESAKAQLTTTEQNVLIEVRSAARALETARRSIVAAQKGRELAEKNLDAEKKKFDNGMTTSFQVTQIQRDLSAARTSELQALAVYRKALASYHYAVADNLDWKGIRVEGIPDTTPPEAAPRAERKP